MEKIEHNMKKYKIHKHTPNLAAHGLLSHLGGFFSGSVTFCAGLDPIPLKGSLGSTGTAAGDYGSKYSRLG